MYKNFFKPLFDITFSSLFLLLVSPVVIIVWIIVFIKLGTPVIFTQLRPGKGEKIFRLYKFRTMTDKTDSKGNQLPDSERITKLGLFLRRTSLDELPQLFNVIKGDLSLVGPRPLLVEYIPLYSAFQKKRHNAKPGITGWAQINGRNTITWEEKFIYDVYYVENITFKLDIKILAITFLKVLKGAGVNNSNGLTMDKFTGIK